MQPSYDQTRVRTYSSQPRISLNLIRKWKEVTLSVKLQACTDIIADYDLWGGKKVYTLTVKLAHQSRQQYDNELLCMYIICKLTM